MVSEVGQQSLKSKREPTVQESTSMQIAGLFTLFEFIQYFKFDKPESVVTQKFYFKFKSVTLKMFWQSIYFLQWDKKENYSVTKKEQNI